MKLKTKGRKVDVSASCGLDHTVRTGQEHVTLKSTSDFPLEISETENKTLKKTFLSFGGDIFLYTQGGKRIYVSLNPKQSKDGEELKVEMCSIENEIIVEGTKHRLQGKWVKEDFPCNKEPTKNIDLEVEK